MSNELEIKIKDLIPAPELKDSAEYPISQEGVTYKVSHAQIEGKVVNKLGDRFVPVAKKGAANGVAPLDENKKIPNENLTFGEVKGGDSNVVSGGEVYNSTSGVIAKLGEEIGGDFFPVFSKGGINASGNEINYVPTQPRMRSSFIHINSENIQILSNLKSFIIFVYSENKTYRYSTSAEGFVLSRSLLNERGFFRLLAKNNDNSEITTTDLTGDVSISFKNIITEHTERLDNIYSVMGSENYVTKWHQGIVDLTSSVVNNAFKHAIYSDLFLTSDNPITISVAPGYNFRLIFYNGVAGTKDNITMTYPSNTSRTIYLSKSYYVRIIIAADDNNVILLPENYSQSGLTFTGLISDYKDLNNGLFKKNKKQLSFNYRNGYYDLVTKVFVPDNKKRSFNIIASENSYINIKTNDSVKYFINFSIWRPDGTLVESNIVRKYISLYLYKGFEITVAIGKADNTEFTGADAIGLLPYMIEDDLDLTHNIPLATKVKKNIYNADEFGMSTSLDDNALALQQLIDIVNTDGGGIIQLPLGAFDFKSRVIVKSNVDIVGYGMGKTILKMVGNERFSLLDNGHIHIENCNYSDFTIDGIDLKPTNTVYSTDMKAFNFHVVKNCVFTRLEVKNTPATGIGIDYLMNVFITNNIVSNCGRLWLDTGGSEMQGGSGIGIGTGWVQEENFVVANNVVEKCGQNGIFIEDQGIFSGLVTPEGRGSIIDSNVVRHGRYNGIALRGNSRIKMTNNFVYNHVNAGFFADKYLRGCDVSNNRFFNNRYGIYAVQGDNRGSYDNSFNSNFIKASTISAINVNGDNSRDFDFRENSLNDNARGIVIEGNSDNFYFESNKIRRSTSSRDLIISGNHNDLYFKNNSVRGVINNTATFTGDVSENDLI